MEKATSDGPNAPTLTEVVTAALKLARDAGRPAAVDLLETAAARLARQDLLIAVVGEFKQGKSSLINGLLGESVLTVDDDLATAVPAIVRFGPERSLRVRRRTGQETTVEDLPFDALVEVGSERGAASLRAGLESIEVALPNRFLEHGLVLIDTPGFGSLRDGYDDLTLAALRTADGAIFVSDASAPLGAAEIDFLSRACSTAAAIVLVITKADLYPETKRIVEGNERLLRARDLQITTVTVSSTLRAEAFRLQDAALNAASGFPALLSAIHSTMLAASADISRARASGEASRAIASLIASLEAEIGVLRDPASAGESVRELREAQAAVELLRGPGARWAQVVGDGYSDLVSEADFRFRSRLRESLRVAEDAIEASDPKDSWEPITASVRAGLGAAVDAILTELQTGAAEIDQRAADVLRAEHLPGLDAQVTGPVDVDALWRGRLTESTPVKQAATNAFSGLRGAQGGIILVGLLTNLAGLALSTGATIGIGALFGGKQLFEERRRQVTARRQQARQAIRQFVDDVQFAASKSLRDLGRDLQRNSRDHFSAHIATTSQELAATVERLRQAASSEDGIRRRDLGTADQRVAAANQLLRLLQPSPGS